MAIWVLESAYRYARAAAILRNASLTFESEVNAALAMELLLKSLLAQPVDNDRRGTVAQQYEVPKSLGIRDGHDLGQLADAIPSDIAERLGLPAIRDVLESKKSVFKHSRYIYEVTAPNGSSETLLGHVCWLLPQVVEHFESIGSADPWLLYMRKHPEKMQVQSIAEG